MRIPQGHRIVNTYLNKFLLKTEPFNGYDANGETSIILQLTRIKGYIIIFTRVLLHLRKVFQYWKIPD